MDRCLNRLSHYTIWTIAFIAVVVLYSPTLFAQGKVPIIFMHANTGVATLYKKPVEGSNYARYTPCGGLGIRYRVLNKNKLYVEAGISIIDRGYQTEVELAAPAGTGNLETHTVREQQFFLTLPVSLCYRYQKFHAGVGPNIGYLAWRRSKIDGETVSKDRNAAAYPVVFGAQLFVGRYFAMSDDLHINLELFVNPTLNADFLNYGLSAGLTYMIASK